MTTRDQAPRGAPCWTDLWTSDVEGSRRFYTSLLGWTALEASPEFHGYFMFARDGVPVAGGMGPMPDNPADDRWKVYLNTDDLAATVAAAEKAGGQVLLPPTPVADLGSQAVLADPTGAVVGAWQPGTFPGFTVLDEPGAPSWFELHTRDHPAAVDFYATVFGWELDVVGDTDEFRYSTMRGPADGGELAGVMDASSFLPGDEPASWTVYWEATSCDEAAARVVELGGSVVAEPADTPYGRIATARDPSGATFRLRGSHSGVRAPPRTPPV